MRAVRGAQGQRESLSLAMTDEVRRKAWVEVPAGAFG